MSRNTLSYGLVQLTSLYLISSISGDSPQVIQLYQNKPNLISSLIGQKEDKTFSFNFKHELEKIIKCFKCMGKISIRFFKTSLYEIISCDI